MTRHATHQRSGLVVDVTLKLLHPENSVILRRGNLLQLNVSQRFIIYMIQIQRLVEILSKIFFERHVRHHLDDFRQEIKAHVTVFILLLAHIRFFHRLVNVKSEVFRDIHVLCHTHSMVFVDVFPENIRSWTIVCQKHLIYWYPSG